MSITGVVHWAQCMSIHALMPLLGMVDLWDYAILRDYWIATDMITDQWIGPVLWREIMFTHILLRAPGHPHSPLRPAYVGHSRSRNFPLETCAGEWVHRLTFGLKIALGEGGGKMAHPEPPLPAVPIKILSLGNWRLSSLGDCPRYRGERSVYIQVNNLICIKVFASLVSTHTVPRNR